MDVLERGVNSVCGLRHPVSRASAPQDRGSLVFGSTDEDRRGPTRLLRHQGEGSSPWVPVTSSHALGITVQAAGGSSSAKSQAPRPARGPCSGTKAPPGTGTLSFSPAAPQHPALCRAQRPQVFGKRLEPVRFGFVQTFLKSLPGRPGITQAVKNGSSLPQKTSHFNLWSRGHSL